MHFARRSRGTDDRRRCGRGRHGVGERPALCPEGPSVRPGPNDQTQAWMQLLAVTTHQAGENPSDSGCASSAPPSAWSERPPGRAAWGDRAPVRHTLLARALLMR